MKITGHKTETVYRRSALSDKSALEEGLGKLSEHLNSSDRDRKVVPMKEAKKA